MMKDMSCRDTLLPGRAEPLYPIFSYWPEIKATDSCERVSVNGDDFVIKAFYEQTTAEHGQTSMDCETLIIEGSSEGLSKIRNVYL